MSQAWRDRIKFDFVPWFLFFDDDCCSAENEKIEKLDMDKQQRKLDKTQNTTSTTLPLLGCCQVRLQPCVFSVGRRLFVDCFCLSVVSMMFVSHLLWATNQFFLIFSYVTGNFDHLFCRVSDFDYNPPIVAECLVIRFVNGSLLLW